MNQSSLSEAEVQIVAEQLAQADRDATPIDAMAHEPVDLADGYRIQAAGHLIHGGDLVAWKAGCTSEASQQLLGIDAPVFGRYRRDHVDRSPTRLSFEGFAVPPRLEVEVGLRLVSDVDGIPRDHLEFADAVEAFAAIEVVVARLSAFPLVGVANLVADNVASGRMIVGPTLDLDTAGVRALDTTPLDLSIGGEVVAAGTGADAAGHPLAVLRDAAIHARAIGDPLRTGDLVITGTCTGLVAARCHVDHVARVGGVEAVVRFD